MTTTFDWRTAFSLSAFHREVLFLQVFKKKKYLMAKDRQWVLQGMEISTSKGHLTGWKKNSFILISRNAALKKRQKKKKTKQQSVLNSLATLQKRRETVAAYHECFWKCCKQVSMFSVISQCTLSCPFWHQLNSHISSSLKKQNTLSATEMLLQITLGPTLIRCWNHYICSCD